MESRRSQGHSDEMFFSEQFVSATERAFGKCPKFSGLRLLAAEARNGFLTARFEGPISDFGGPYGVIAQLPTNKQDNLWARYAGTDQTVDDWAHSGVAMRALDAHKNSRHETRGYTPDGIWWLVNDTLTTGQI